MSKQIDFSKPLSEEDKQYALERNMHIDVQENELKFGGTQNTGEMVPVQVSGLNGNEPSRFADKKESNGIGLAQINAGTEAIVGETPETVEVDEVVVEETSETVEVDDDDYSTWSIEDLKAELGDRQLSKSGNKAELVARLIADDQNSE